MILIMFSAVIQGIVRDLETKEYLPYANINIEGTELGAATDEKGVYRINNIKKGKYTLVVSYIGYQTIKKKINIKDDKRYIVNFSLPLTPLQLKTVKVSGRRKKFLYSPGITTLEIGKREIKSVPAFIEADPIKAVQLLPGIVKPTDFTTGLYVRGGSSDQNLIRLDDITVLNPAHFGGLFSTFNADIVKSTELYAGAFPSVYGGRISAVLDVHSRGGGKKLGGNLTVSMLSSKASLFGPLFDIGDFTVSLRRTYADEIIPIITLGKYTFPYYFYDAYARVSLKPIKKNTYIYLSGFVSSDTLFFADESTKENVNIGWQNRIASLRILRKINEHMGINTSFGYTYFYQGINVLDSFMVYKNLVQGPELHSSLKYTFSENNKLRLGFDGYIMDFLYDADLQEDFNFSLKDISYEIGIFVDDIFKYKKFIIEPGVRGNYFYTENADKFYLLPDPRFSIKYLLSEMTAVNFAFGRHHQFMVAIKEENEILQFINQWAPITGRFGPMEAYHYVLGIEQWFKYGFNGSVEFYYKDMNNLLVRTSRQEMDLNDYKNTYLKEPGTGYALGMDMILKKGLGKLTGWISYSLSYTEVTFDKTYTPAWNRRHVLNLISSYELPYNISLNVLASFYTGNPYTPVLYRKRVWYRSIINYLYKFFWYEVEGEINSERYPPYFRMDIGISKKFLFSTSELSLALNIVNLTNYKNIFFYMYDYTKEPPVRKAVTMLPFLPSIEISYRF